MSKRLKIIPQNKINSELKELIDKDLSLVLNNDSVLFGQIKKHEESSVIFRDKRNSKHKIEIKNIQEIIIDQVIIDA